MKIRENDIVTYLSKSQYIWLYLGRNHSCISKSLSIFVVSRSMFVITMKCLTSWSRSSSWSHVPVLDSWNHLSRFQVFPWFLSRQARPGHAPGESTTGKNPGCWCWCWVAGVSLWEHSREGEGHKYVDFPFISDFWWLIIRGKIRWKLDQILHFVEFSMHHHFSV